MNTDFDVILADVEENSLFYMRHIRSVIERTLIEAGIPAPNATTWAFEACSPSNVQIRRDSQYFEIWSRIEPRRPIPIQPPRRIYRTGPSQEEGKVSEGSVPNSPTRHAPSM